MKKLIAFTLTAFIAMVGASANAQTFTSLLSFSGTSGQYPGANPICDLTLSGSTLFGMTSSGGSANGGAIFSVGVDGTNYRNLFSFSGTNASDPNADLTLVGSTLYGMTVQGGIGNYGTIFSIGVDGSNYQNLLSFTGTNGPYLGAGPSGALTLGGSTMYGTTRAGGSSGDGNVFSIGLNGTNYQNLLSLNGSNGQTQYGSVTLGGSTLYGMSAYGGLNGFGAIFSLGANGTNNHSLLSFTGTGGSFPGNQTTGNLTLSGSTLYGMTSLGGTGGYGNIFSVGIDGTNYKNLLSFNGANGSVPYGSLTFSGSILYGMTTGIGSKYGNIFTIGADGTGYHNLFSFNQTNGSEPYGDLTLSGSTLYGMTNSGGSSNKGTVFSITIPPPIPATIALANPQNATVLESGPGTLGITVINSASAGYNLNYTLTAAVTSGTVALGAVTPAAGILAPGTSQACTIPLAPRALGVTTVSFTASDPNSSNLSQTATATVTVLDHASGAFSNGNTMLTLAFGALQQGSGTQALQFQIENLPAAYRAGLALESITKGGDPSGVFSTDATPFPDLAPGAESDVFNVYVDTSQLGRFAGGYGFAVSDEQDISGHSTLPGLVLIVRADVIAPEPSSLALLAAGVTGLLGWAWRHRLTVRA